MPKITVLAPYTITAISMRGPTLFLSGRIENSNATTEAPTAGEALRANATKMTAVIASLKKGGLTDRDIQTSNLSINPQYVYEQNQPPRLSRRPPRLLLLNRLPHVAPLPGSRHLP